MTQTWPDTMETERDMSTEAEGPRRRRKLSAIMMVDVKGFSALMGSDEDSTVDLIQHFHGRVRRHVKEHEGRVVDTAGDSVFAEFDSVVNAVRCARTIQEDLAAANKDREDGRGVLTRIGVHLGDVIVEDYQVYGDGVNIAARLEPLADPGGICISEAVYQQIRNKLDLPLEDMGLHNLKNIQYPVHLYRVPPPQLINGDPADAGAAPAASAAPIPPAPPPPAAEPTPPPPPVPPADRTEPSGVREAAEALRREIEKEITPHLKEAGEIARREIARGAEIADREVRRAGLVAARETRRAAKRAAREAKRAAKHAKRHRKWAERAEEAPHPEDSDEGGVLRKAETAAERALRSALGEREDAPTTSAETPPAPHEKIDAELRSWLDDIVRTGNLIQLVVGFTLLLSPFILFPTGGVFPTGGAILISVVLGSVWAKRAGRSGNFLLALGIGIASGAVWTNWSGVTNTLFLLAGLIVAVTGTGRRRHRHR